MKLNTLSPAPNSKFTKKRAGRGIGSGLGKTGGRGHKGQKARSGGYHKVGFEGGQMPLQKRLPKFGFVSRKSLQRAELRLSDLNKVMGDVVDLLSLEQAGLLKSSHKQVKIFASGEVKKALTIKGVPISKGARLAIEAAGGTVEEEHAVA